MEKLAFFSFHFKCFPLLFSLDKVICPIYSNKHCVHLGRETINHDNARRSENSLKIGLAKRKMLTSFPNFVPIAQTRGIFQDSDFIGSISFRFSGKLTPAQTLLVHWISDISQALARNGKERKGKETGGRSRFGSKLHERKAC